MVARSISGFSVLALSKLITQVAGEVKVTKARKKNFETFNLRVRFLNSFHSGKLQLSF